MKMWRNPHATLLRGRPCTFSNKILFDFVIIQIYLELFHKDHGCCCRPESEPTRRSDFGGVVAETAAVLLSLDMIACCPLFVIVTISLLIESLRCTFLFAYTFVYF